MNLTLELSGLNLERLLRAAGACGVRMKNVRRMDERTMRVVVPAAQKKRMAALCEKYGWQMAEIRAGGLLRLARGAKGDGRSASVLLSIFWVYLSSEMIWRVEIDGAGKTPRSAPLSGSGKRARRAAETAGFDGSSGRCAGCRAGLAHAAARYEGSTLVVDCQRAREGERAGVAGQGRRSSRAEGVIVRISAESGTPR
ncbi:MAG: sporulation protein YqfD [Christensenellales bacterium]